jgi:hypothetical protein
MTFLNCICGHQTPCDITAPMREIRCEKCGRDLLMIMGETVMHIPRTAEGVVGMVIGNIVLEVIEAAEESMPARKHLPVSYHRARGRRFRGRWGR